MSQSLQPSEIKQQLSKFINLLQNDFQASSPSSPCTNDYPLHKNLSVIFSASQPESSSLDKQNSNPSANRSFDTNQKPCEAASYRSLINNLLLSPLSVPQLKSIERLKMYTDELVAQNKGLRVHIEQVRAEHASEKNANDEMLAVLVKLDKQEKELWGNYNLLSGKYQEASEKGKGLEGDCERMRESLLSLQNDNDFMKKLIFHANQNYEALERKCLSLEEQERDKSMYSERPHPKKSSMDNLLKSAKTKKNGYSPSHSQLGRTPSPDRFQDVYRKMIIRTLKYKGKHH